MATTYTATANTDGWVLTATNAGSGTTYVLKDPNGSVVYSGSNPLADIRPDNSLTAENKKLFQGGAGYSGLSINGKKNQYVALSGKVSTLVAGLGQMVQETNASISTQQKTTSTPAISAVSDTPLRFSSTPSTVNEISVKTGKPTGNKITISPPTVPYVAAADQTVKYTIPPLTIDEIDIKTGKPTGKQTTLDPITITPPPVQGITAAKSDAQAQATSQDQANFNAKEDWRVRLSLAPDAKYLYKANNPGILQPLQKTDGVVFPYTPLVSVAYNATYDQTNLVHSNYKVFQYTSSSVDSVTLTCDFTAQDTFEANYILATIHFFRTLTKMFYGQDTDPRPGTPPPLCYMFGMGGYQFAAHPLAVTGFQYNLPNDVDYIPTTSVSEAGTIQPEGTSVPIDRTQGKLGLGGTAPGPSFNKSANTNTTSWVPTKIQLSISCIPIVSRNKVSNQFSLQNYATGNLLNGTQIPGGGFW